MCQAPGGCRRNTTPRVSLLGSDGTHLNLSSYLEGRKMPEARKSPWLGFSSGVFLSAGMMAAGREWWWALLMLCENFQSMSYDGVQPPYKLSQTPKEREGHTTGRRSQGDGEPLRQPWVRVKGTEAGPRGSRGLRKSSVVVARVGGGGSQLAVSSPTDWVWERAGQVALLMGERAGTGWEWPWDEAEGEVGACWPLLKPQAAVSSACPGSPLPRVTLRRSATSISKVPWILGPSFMCPFPSALTLNMSQVLSSLSLLRQEDPQVQEVEPRPGGGGAAGLFPGNENATPSVFICSCSCFCSS